MYESETVQTVSRPWLAREASAAAQSEHRAVLRRQTKSIHLASRSERCVMLTAWTSQMPRESDAHWDEGKLFCRLLHSNIFRLHTLRRINSLISQQISLHRCTILTSFYISC